MTFVCVLPQIAMIGGPSPGTPIASKMDAKRQTNYVRPAIVDRTLCVFLGIRGATLPR